MCLGLGVWEKITTEPPAFVEHLLYTSHCTKCFACVLSCSSLMAL